MKTLMFILAGLVSWQAHALQVTVTIPPLAAMVKPYLTPDDTLTVLLSPGASPHGFQFRPSHLTALNEADLILTVGSGVDRWADKAIRQMMAERAASADDKTPTPVWVVMQKQPAWPFCRNGLRPMVGMRINMVMKSTMPMILTGMKKPKPKKIKSMAMRKPWPH